MYANNLVRITACLLVILVSSNNIVESRGLYFNDRSADPHRDHISKASINSVNGMDPEQINVAIPILQQCLDTKDNDRIRAFIMKCHALLKAIKEKSAAKRSDILDTLLDYYYYKNFNTRGEKIDTDKVNGLAQQFMDKQTEEELGNLHEFMEAYQTASIKDRSKFLEQVIDYATKCAQEGNNDDYFKLVITSMKTLFTSYDKNDYDVRLTTEEYLHQLAKNLKESDLRKIQVELHRIIKHNPNVGPKALKG
ncbi:unnamed protein product [Rotaria sp. Silwood1]|nr:unnamed protein product [Rotaria sp. Silwood1]